jgi:hypothetical protein
MADEFMAEFPQQNQDIIPDQGSSVALDINEVEMEVNSSTTAFSRGQSLVDEVQVQNITQVLSQSNNQGHMASASEVQNFAQMLAQSNN